MSSIQKTAGAGSSVGSAVSWSNPSNILTSNNLYATAYLSYGNGISNYLQANQFGFSIPSTATIDGIVCTVERKSGASSTIKDYSVQVIKAGTTISTDRKNTAVYWSTSEGSVSFGSPTDLWGTTWTYSDINNSSTGFSIRCEFLPLYGNDTAYVDNMLMTVYYTDGGTNINYSTTSIGSVYFGSTQIQSVYYGSTQIF